MANAYLQCVSSDILKLTDSHTSMPMSAHQPNVSELKEKQTCRVH